MKKIIFSSWIFGTLFPLLVLAQTENPVNPNFGNCGPFCGHGFGGMMGWGLGWGGLVFSLLFWIVVIILIVYLIRYLLFGGHRDWDHRYRDRYEHKDREMFRDREKIREERYAHILKERFAKGEITKEEYKERMDELKNM